jgi:hypothetical protein
MHIRITTYVLDRSNTVVVGSNLDWDMDVQKVKVKLSLWFN